MAHKTGKTVGRQAKLPTSKAVEIAWKSIRQRLSRSLVVTSGIILAMAFLMYILCSDSTTEGMRQWTYQANSSSQFVAARARVEETQPKVQSLSDTLIKASVELKGATKDLDDKKTFGKELSQIQRELGSLPVAPDSMKKLLGTRPEMVAVFQQWMDTTAQLREAKSTLSGPQQLTAMMKASGVPTTPQDIANNKVQTRWMIGLALLVAFVGILNAMLMSVTERFREIGTMKCLGALDSFIVKLFLIESFFQGGAGTFAGVLLGLLLNLGGITAAYGGFAWKMFPYRSVAMAGGICMLVGVILTVAGAVYPAWRAARMHPIEAMRVEA
jgi:putative ABC transport system permease protein